MPHDVIHQAAVAAVKAGLDGACATHNILPPRDISAHLWAESILAQSLTRGCLPTKESLESMLEGIPPLFISDRNK